MNTDNLSPEEIKIKELEKANKKLRKKIKKQNQINDFYEDYKQPYNEEYEKRRDADTKYILVVMGVGVLLMFISIFISWLCLTIF